MMLDDVDATHEESNAYKILSPRVMFSKVRMPGQCDITTAQATKRQSRLSMSTSLLGRNLSARPRELTKTGPVR